MGSQYDTTPFIVIWETTRACDLACKHCRAAAIKMRNPDELTTSEAFRLIDDIAEMRPQPNFVLTGGDPMKRPDLVEIIRYAAKERQVRISITPSATPLVTRDAIQACAEAGLSRWAFSIDGATAQAHDDFRGQEGSFAITMRAIEDLRSFGLPLQINTTVSRYNQTSLAEIGALVEHLGAVLWSVFFLVPVGRGKAADALDALETEEVLHWLDSFARDSRCDVKTTEAPQWHRVRRQLRGEGAFEGGVASHDVVGRAPRPVTDGDGFVFVSHKGEVYPSGFLPVVVGNVREKPLSEIYRTAPELLLLRDRSNLRGKCRYCEFRDICGGSRSRAYAITGDYLESDPYCPYMPNPAEGRRITRENARAQVRVG
ncbi:MAG: TIGR04053 family radical SAM/SPASM domain-containing protein [Thermaerobacter sp.]|nr:TIGR04053 family radical SAM/SPASM domain-containing protein [Thermaerobacter sp.]